jgi:Tol biopolymer transport system component
LRPNDRNAGGEALIPWVLAAAILLLGASSCTNDASVGAPTSNPTIAASGEQSPVTSQAHSPASEAKELGIFSEVGGWIAYGNDKGIWAVNPTPRSTPMERIQLSERLGEPLAWSSDGSKLLIRREVSDATRNPVDNLDLFVLNADGTETRLTRGLGWSTGSISPDGSKVVYAATTWPSEEASARGEEWQSGMYVVEADGGSRRLLLAAGPRDYPDGTFRTALFQPTFSPDGTQIAYFVGGGDWGNTLRVMNADGSDVRVVIDQEFGHVNDLAWSPDGSRLAFHAPYGGGIWIVGVDGSGLTEVSQWGAAPRWSPTGRQLAFESAGGIWVINPDGSGLRQLALPGRRDPVWSPDGSRIAYLVKHSLYVADLDGTHVRTLGTLELTPSPKPPVVWIPLPLSASGETDSVLRRDGEILGYTGDLIAMDPRTGETRVLVHARDIPHRIGNAAWSADGRWVAYDIAAESGLFVVNADREPRQVALDPGPWTWSPTAPKLAMVRNSRLTVVDASTGRQTDLGDVVGDVTSAPVWSPDGTRILFGARGGSLYSVDVRSGERSLFVRLPGEDLDSMDQIAWSPDGAHLAILNDLEPGGGRLYVMDADGSNLRVLVDDVVLGGFDWSPDGTRLTYPSFSGPDERELRIWTVSLDGSGPSLVASHTNDQCCIDGGSPVWSPDGSQIAFETDRSRFVINADGTGEARHIDELTYLNWHGGWYFCFCYG